MRLVRRVMGLLATLFAVGSAAAAVAALNAKRQFVPLDDPAADEVRLGAMFAPLYFRSTATAFRGGTIECRYGGGIVDLRDAVPDPNGVHLTVRAIFGGGQIVVPEGWTVTTSVRGIGGLQDTRPKLSRDEDAPRLVIEGTALFGGFAVQSEVPDEAVEGLRKAVAAQRARSEEGEPLPA